MQIIREKLEIEDSLEKKINNILKFLNITSNLKNGNIINIKNTNLAYIEPHKLKINNYIYLFFNGCNEVFLNTLETKIPLNQLEAHIKMNLIINKEMLTK